MKTETDFLKRLMMLSKACGFTLTHDWAELYDRALSRFGYDSATTAIEQAILERRGTDRMPSIGDLVQKLSPVPTDQDEAVEVAGRVLSAISKFGWSGQQEAFEYIGEIGLAVVDRNGGWAALCESVRERDIPTWRAQLREQAGAVIRRQKAGVLDRPPEFGETSRKNVAALIGHVLNKSEEYDDKTRTNRTIPPEPERRKLNAQSDS